MSLFWASLALVLSLPFLLWPLLRHQEIAAAAELATGPGSRAASAAARQAALLAIEEVELDEASGRLDAQEARSRLAELRGDAERLLRGS